MMTCRRILKLMSLVMAVALGLSLMPGMTFAEDEPGRVLKPGLGGPREPAKDTTTETLKIKAPIPMVVCLPGFQKTPISAGHLCTSGSPTCPSGMILSSQKYDAESNQFIYQCQKLK